MKEFLKNIYKYLYGEDLIQTIPGPVPIVPIKTSGEKLYDFAMTFFNTDPTPQDLQSDEYACAESLTTILKKYLGDFPIITYTPNLLVQLKNDKRFKLTNEFKPGNVIISPTLTGNGSIVGHTGLIGLGGEILSNSSATGLWTNKFNNLSWIERYSKQGQLDLYLFELVL